MQAILPQIDMAGLYSTLRPGQPLGFATDPPSSATYLNYQAARTPVAVYLCPSDATSGNGLLGARAAGSGRNSVYPNALRAVNNYKACSRANWSTSTNWANTCPTGRWANYDNALLYCNGVMCSNSIYGLPSDPTIVSRNTTKIADVKDGLSNTFAIGEAVPAYNAWSWWFCNNTTVATRAIPLNNLYATSDTQESIFNWPENWCFCSFHPGAGFSMCDGSVAFISDNIDFGIYHAWPPSMSARSLKSHKAETRQESSWWCSVRRRDAPPWERPIVTAVFRC